MVGSGTKGAAMLAVLALLFSGCAGTSVEPTPAAAATTEAPVLGDAVIAGRVVDDELQPIAAARVVLLPDGRETRSDESGDFRFDGLAPATYEVQVEKSGYKTRRQRVDAGPDAAPMKIQLEPVPVAKARVENRSLRGFLACSFSYTEPTVFPDEYSVCRNIPETNDKTVLDFTVTDGLRGLLVETIWNPTTPLAKNLKVRIQKGPGGGAFTDGPLIGEARGTSVLRVEVRTAALAEAAKNGVACLEGCLLTSMTASSPALGTPVDAGAALQQDFDQWLSIYYWQDVPEGASAIPTGGKVR